MNRKFSIFNLLTDLFYNAKSRITCSVISGVVWGVIIVGFIAFLLNTFFHWKPEYVQSIQITRDFLIGIIQIQAGILAIAVSTSLLYLQVSAEAYSLRSSQLLIKSNPFRQMVRDYVFILLVNCLFSIFVTEEPKFIPLLFSITGIILFISSILVLLSYISRIAEFIKPEVVVNQIFSDLSSRNTLYTEAVAKLLPPSLEFYNDNAKRLSEIRIETPLITGPADQFGEGMRMLIDIARQMIHQADYSVINEVLGGFIKPYEEFGIKNYDRFYDDNWNFGQEEIKTLVHYRELDAKEIRYMLEKGSLIAYLVGGLLQIWSAAIWSNNKIVALEVIKAMQVLLSRQLMEDHIYYTDILNSAIRDNLLSDTSKPKWQDLRPHVIKIVSRSADLHVRTSTVIEKGANRYEYFLGILFKFLTELFYDLEKEKPIDNVSLVETYLGIQRLGAFGGYLGSTLVSDFGLFLGRSVGKHLEIYHRWVASDVEEIGTLLASAGTYKNLYVPNYQNLLNMGLNRFVSMRFTKLHEMQSDEPLYTLFYPALDALERISIECVEKDQSVFLAEALENMYDLGSYLIPNLEYALACISKSLEKSIETSNFTALQTWLKVSQEKITRWLPISKEALQRLFVIVEHKKFDIQNMYQKHGQSKTQVSDLYGFFKKLDSNSSDETYELTDQRKIKDWQPHGVKENPSASNNQK